MWSRPPCEAARPESLRTTVTSVVSKIGMKRMRTGTATTTMKLRPRSPAELNRAELERKKPMNIEPQSPMKIEAGFELKARKPTSAAAKVASSMASVVCPLMARLAAMKTAAMADTPAASPSMLSSRLMAFVMPMSQKIVTVTPSEADQPHGSVRPK